MPWKSRSRVFLIASLLSLSLSWPCAAQVPEPVSAAFRQWAARSLHPVSDATLDAPTRDLRPLESMIGNARIVALSEGVHAGTEPLVFRNRLFKYLVEELQFRAIVLESGFIEAQALNQFVTGGPGELDAIARQGFSAGFDTFRQNRELVRWIRQHNSRLPRGAAKVQIYGMDVPGGAGNLDGARGPETAIETTLDYLSKVDPPAAVTFRSRVATALRAVSTTNDYGTLSQPERDALTAAVADMNSAIQLRRHEYIAKSSTDEYAWGERAAIGARQMDDWFRRMPLGWKLADGFDWLSEAISIRDRAMADNLDWILERVGRRSRVLVFAAIPHITSLPLQEPTVVGRDIVPFGLYAKERFGDGFISIYNPVANGQLLYCSARPRRVMPLQPPPPTSLEALFASVGEPRYILDLRTAPPSVSAWLSEYQDYWNGFGLRRLAAARSFDLAYFVTPITSDCIPE